MLPSSILVDGKSKLEDYIKYREDRDKAIVACFKDENKTLEINEIYEVIYGSRGLSGRIRDAAMNNLDLHLKKLVKEGLITMSDKN
jgi:hypothetical protein